MKVYTCFPGGKAKALTMSYDDGKLQDKRLIGIFNKYGIKATFNLNYGQVGERPRMTFEEMEGLYDGHEIATHTMTHPTIERCPLVEVAEELLEDRKGLEKWTGRIIRGHAYPNGSYSEEIKQLYRQLGVAYARVVETVPDFALPKDPLEWHATCHHNDPKLMEYAEFFADFKKSQYLKLMKAILLEQDRKKKNGKKLNCSDEKNLQRAEKMLISEFAIVFNITVEKARDSVFDAVFEKEKDA